MRAVLRWSLAGLACAVVARVGMMLLTRHPEPTRSGTVAIWSSSLGGWRSGSWTPLAGPDAPWTRLVALVGVGIFLGAGAVFLPSTLVGGAFLSHRRVPTWARLAAVVAVLGWGMAMVRFASADNDPLGLFLASTGLMAGVGRGLGASRSSPHGHGGAGLAPWVTTEGPAQSFGLQPIPVTPSLAPPIRGISALPGDGRNTSNRAVGCGHGTLYAVLRTHTPVR
jgi:hypothetical protein